MNEPNHTSGPEVIRAFVRTLPAFETGHGFIGPRQAVAGHHDDHFARAGGQQALHRPADDRAATEGAPRLGFARSGAETFACGDDNG